MSTIKKANERAKAAKVPAEPIDIDAAMARLILLRKFHELPRPVKYEIGTGEFGTFHGIYVYVATGQDVTAWANALGIAEHGCGSFLGHDGSLYYDASVDGWHGWYVRVVSEAPAGSAAPSELDADTVAGLEAIASPTEPVQIPAERVNEILAELNRLSQDPDGNGREPDWWDWIHDAVPEFDAEATAASSDSGTLHLTDGTVFVWERQAKAWAVSA